MTTWRIWHPYKIVLIQELTWVDRLKRRLFSTWAQEKLEHNPDFLKENDLFC